MWPQYVYLSLTFIGLGVSISNHGKPRTKENALTTIFATGLVLFLLTMGGFFKGF